MKLEKITYYDPPDSNSLVFNIDLNIENNTEFIVEMIKVACHLLDQDIKASKSFESKVELFVESNKAELVNIETLLIKSEKNNKDKLKVMLNICTYRREYYDLGAIGVLDKMGCVKVINTEIKQSSGVRLLKLKYCQYEAHEENDSVQIDVDAIFYNTTNIKIEDLVFGMHIIGDKNEIVASSSSSEVVDSNSKKNISIRCLSLKSGKIKRSKLWLYLSIYLPIITKTISGVAIKE